MANFRDLDPSVGFRDQLQARSGPIVLANVMNVPPAELDEQTKVWAADAAFMRAQAGFISTQLHRGIAGSGALLNIAVWESAAALRAAFFSEEFQRQLAAYSPAVTVAPHIFERVAVPGICIA